VRFYGGFLNPCKWYDLSKWSAKSYGRLPKSYFYMKHMGEIMLVNGQILEAPFGRLVPGGSLHLQESFGRQVTMTF
jgi:hypothetical protein